MKLKYLAVLFPITCATIAGCGSEEIDAHRIDRMVYVDTKTNQPIVHEIVRPVPAVNPETGDRTLMPGLYCPTCKTWYAVPPPDQINSRQNAGQCPKDKTPLIAEGPWPGEVSAADEKAGT